MSDLADALGRTLKKVATDHRRPFAVAFLAGLLATATTMGLVAWIDAYALGLLGLVILFFVLIVAVRQEQRGRLLQARVDRMDHALRDVASALKPLTEGAQVQGDGLKALQQSLAVVELTTVDSAKAVERIRETLDADRG